LPKLKKGILDLAGAIPGLISKADRLAQYIGGWGNVAMVAAGILSRPLVGSLLGLIGPIKGLGLALAATPFGLILGLGAGLAGLMAHAGVLEPFLSGVAKGFSDISAGLSESLVGLMKTVSGLFGDAAAGLRDANGEINPEAWKALGESIGKVAGGALKDFVDLLDKAAWLAGKIGSGIGRVVNFLADDTVDESKTNTVRMRMDRARLKSRQERGEDVADQIQEVTGRIAEAERINKTVWSAAGERRADRNFGPQLRAPASPLGASASPYGPPALGPGSGSLGALRESKHTEVQKTETTVKFIPPSGWGLSIGNSNPGGGTRLETLYPASKLGLANW
jgi:hypothetical protein